MPELSQRSFDALLAWLDPDRDRAGEKYELIRCKLIKLFERRDCLVPEELADITIDRVTRRLGEGLDIHTHDPYLFFHGVAVRVLHEYRERPASVPIRDTHGSVPPDSGSNAATELRSRYLDQCLQALPASARALIQEYYQLEKGAKIRNRRQLAARLGLTPNALRLQAYRIREQLQACVWRALARAGLQPRKSTKTK